MRFMVCLNDGRSQECFASRNEAEQKLERLGYVDTFESSSDGGTVYWLRPGEGDAAIEMIRDEIRTEKSQPSVPS